jgi:hypothetical protein
VKNDLGLSLPLVRDRASLGFTTRLAGQKGTVFGQRPNTLAAIYARFLTLLEAAHMPPVMFKRPLGARGIHTALRSN